MMLWSMTITITLVSIGVVVITIIKASFPSFGEAVAEGLPDSLAVVGIFFEVLIMMMMKLVAMTMMISDFIYLEPKAMPVDFFL